MDYSNKNFSPDTIVSGIVCNKCHVTLPPHTVAEHLDIKFMKELHDCGLEMTLVKLARFQYQFSGMKIQEIWGTDVYQHYAKKWVESEVNLLTFFTSLDSDNKKILIDYIEERI